MLGKTVTRRKVLVLGCEDHLQNLFYMTSILVIIQHDFEMAECIEIMNPWEDKLLVRIELRVDKPMVLKPAWDVPVLRLVNIDL